MKIVYVHTKPDCVQCDAVKRYLDRHGIDYEVHPLTRESTARFAAVGILAAPVVELPGEEPFGGYRVPLLDAWRARHKEPAYARGSDVVRADDPTVRGRVLDVLFGGDMLTVKWYGGDVETFRSEEALPA